MPQALVSCKVDSIEKPRYPLSGACGIDDRKFNCFIPCLGAGAKDSAYQIDLILLQILRANRGQRVLCIVADCGPLTRNRALAYGLPAFLVATGQYEAVYFNYLNQLHSKQICDENFGCICREAKGKDIMRPEELARACRREGTDSDQNGGYLMNPSAMQGNVDVVVEHFPRN